MPLPLLDTPAPPPALPTLLLPIGRGFRPVRYKSPAAMGAHQTPVTVDQLRSPSPGSTVAMTLLKTLPALLLLVGLASAFEEFSGACPNHPAVDNFQLPQFMGKWNVYAKYLKDKIVLHKCESEQYNATEDGKFRIGRLSVGAGDPTLAWYGKVTYSFGTAVPYKPKGKPVEKARFRILNDGLSPPGPNPTFNILSVKYNQYALIHGCEALTDTKNKQEFIILTRAKKVGPTLWKTIKKDMKKFKIKRKKLTFIVQDDCKELSGSTSFQDRA